MRRPERIPSPRLAAALALGALLAGAPARPVAGEGARASAGDVAATPPAPWLDAVPQGPSVAARLEEIRRRVEAALAYPPDARWRDQGGAALVEFEIGSDGRAREVRLARSSGLASLDRAATRAVEDAGELPYVYGRLRIPVRFALDGPP
jgi:protein TonB